MQATMIKRLFLTFVIAIAAVNDASAQTIKVAAAANLQTVFTSKIIPDFEAKTGITVTPVFGATKTLEQQLENGAPYEVFVSADTSTVTKLASEGLIDPSSEKAYAVGKLVIWTRNDAAIHPKFLSDLNNSSIEHIAVANPKTAPYGLAAIQSLTSSGLLGVLTSKIVYAENIQQSLQYAVTGNADVAFTALSLVIDRTDGTYLVVPPSLHKPIEQSLGVAVNASTAAKQFAAYLTSPEADKTWSSSGYSLP